jgi:hypothetical protein
VSTHVLRRRKTPHIPVLCGYAIPRKDLESQSEKYAVAILGLFRPWARSRTDPLKAPSVSWSSALSVLLATLSPPHLKVIGHMQEQWECKLAADLYSVKRQKRYAGNRAENGFLSSEEISDDLANDIDWQLGQLDGAIGLGEEGQAGEMEDSNEFEEASSDRARLATESVIALSAAASFYRSPPVAPSDLAQHLLGQPREAGPDSRQEATAASQLLAAEKAAFLETRSRVCFSCYLVCCLFSSLFRMRKQIDIGLGCPTSFQHNSHPRSNHDYIFP